MDVGREQVMPLTGAARFVGKLRGTAKVAVQTLMRWATKGSRGVVLETICSGGSRCTSVEALQRFFDAVTEAKTVTSVHGPQPQAAAVAMPRRGVDLGNVDEVLRRAGIVADERGAA